MESPINNRVQPGVIMRCRLRGNKRKQRKGRETKCNSWRSTNCRLGVVDSPINKSTANVVYTNIDISGSLSLFRSIGSIWRSRPPRRRCPADDIYCPGLNSFNSLENGDGSQENVRSYTAMDGKGNRSKNKVRKIARTYSNSPVCAHIKLL